MQLSRQQITISIAILILIFAIIRFGSELAAEQSNNKKRSHVKAVDIGESVDIIGRLGEPMATVVDIEGHWEEGPRQKPSTLVFVVSSVSGKMLPAVVKFNDMAVSIRGKGVVDEKKSLNEVWRCKAIELGAFRNVPEKNWELFFESPVSPPAWGDGPFVSDLILCKSTLRRIPSK